MTVVFTQARRNAAFLATEASRINRARAEAHAAVADGVLS